MVEVVVVAYTIHPFVSVDMEAIKIPFKEKAI